MKLSVIIKLSAAIDKMDVDLESLQSGDEKQMGIKLVSLLAKNLHKAEDEILDLVAEYKGITKEEAKEADIIEVMKDIFSEGGVKDFFS